MSRLGAIAESHRLLLLAALALASLAVGTAMFSGARFSSKSTNSASLAAASVQIGSTMPNQAIVAATGMEPGGSSQGTISISNDGDVAGTVTLKASGLTGAVLADVVELRIDDVTGSTSKKWSGKLDTFSQLSLGSFAVDATRKYRFTLSWPSSADEASLQGTSTSVALKWEMDNGFTASTQNTLSVGAATDWTAPTVSASAIVRTGGGIAGYVKASGTYYVYANATDSGNPASGVATVKANVGSITSGQSSVTLTAGSYTAAGVSYKYRSAQLTASNVSGSKNYTVTATDSAGNSGSESFSSTAFKGAFEADGFDLDNGPSGTSGKPEKGDDVVLEFNREVDPASIVSGWNGSGTKSVTVTISNNSSDDQLSVSGATTGTIALKGDFVASTVNFTGSTLSLEGATVTIVLGTASGSVKTVTGNVKPVWSPSTSIRDVVGDACSSATVTGGNARQF